MIRRTILLLGFMVISSIAAMAQNDVRGKARDEVAKRFAPVLIQEQSQNPKLKRFDFPTRVDFAGDSDAVRNWERAKQYPLPAYTYYSVAETETHYFLFYCWYYPRDWKGGVVGTRLLSFFHPIFHPIEPTRIFQEVAFHHENDFEGILVVVAKYPSPRVIAVESLAHSHLEKFVTEDFLADHPGLKGVKKLFLADKRPLIVAESRGHGDVSPEWRHPKNYRVFSYQEGVAEDPEKTDSLEVSYALLDVKKTFWDMSESDAKKFFAKRQDYSSITVPILQDGEVKMVSIEKRLVGTNIRGRVGARNVARMPWKWEGITLRRIWHLQFRHPEMRHGEWFFDPANVVGKHLELNEKEFSRAYVSHSYATSSAGPERAGN